MVITGDVRSRWALLLSEVWEFEDLKTYNKGPDKEFSLDPAIIRGADNGRAWPCYC